MDNMLGVHSKKANKQPKNTKKKPVKVVYISNPMKVHTSAAEFRALVQQLTGQHANYPAPTTTTHVGSSGTKGFYFAESPESSQPSAGSDDQQAVVVQGDNSTTTHVVLPNYVVNNNNNNNNEGTITDNSDLSFEDYVAEDYVPELLENYLPSNLWYD